MINPVSKMDLQIGQIVYSKAGRDKGECFVVVATEGSFAHLVDGRNRPIERPKLKKRMHIQHTNTVDKQLAQAIISGAHLKNSDFRTAIKNATQRLNDEIQDVIAGCACNDSVGETENG
ncbi:MAG: KOW domain-containing RNA-binding protein [Defluviitaleaceae bacterium]|nr:KOW domain-containing RNA-binding protein [Defluviitaleaceae bacterium]